MNASNFKYWLRFALSDENLQAFEVEITESSEDFQENVHVEKIYLVKAIGMKTDGSMKIYYLVVRRMKKIETLKKEDRLMEAYRKEMYVYTKMIPYFERFQDMKGVRRFQGFPKFVGIYTLDSFEAVVLHDLEKIGFRKFRRNHGLLDGKQLLMIAEEYGKFHAISASLKDQDLELYFKVMKGLDDRRPYFYEIFKQQLSKNSPRPLFKELSDENWSQVQAGILNILHPGHCSHVYTVVMHGDLWESNIMIRQKQGVSCRKSLDVVFSEWHRCRVGAPVLDVIFSTLNLLGDENSRNAIIPTVLNTYYQSLVKNGQLYGTHINQNYSLIQMWKDRCASSIFSPTMQSSIAQQHQILKPLADLYVKLL